MDFVVRRAYSFFWGLQNSAKIFFSTFKLTFIFFLVFGFIALALSPSYAPAQEIDIPGVEVLRERLAETETIEVIAWLKEPSIENREWPSEDEIKSAQAGLIAYMREAGVEPVKLLKNVPAVVFAVDNNGLEALIRSELLKSIQENTANRPFTQDSTQIIYAQPPWNLGFDGTDWTVVIVDTGVNHPQLNIVDEACFSTTGTSPTRTSLCPNTQDVQIGSGAGIDCIAVSGGIAGCDHGTHVGGIAGSNSTLPSVAPGADIIAIQVFTQVDDAVMCAPAAAPCILTFDADLVDALSEVLNNFSLSNDIAAVNMSLGGGAFNNATVCDIARPALESVISALEASGIATIVASGNASEAAKISSPACLSKAVSVGATNKIDAVAGYSNIAFILDLLAPGSDIGSTIPGNATATKSGTSMAAPHVAGCWAMMKQQNPGASVTDILSTFVSTGVPLSRPQVNIVKPRLNCGGALASNLGADGGQICGLKYQDINENGVQDGTEPGLAGWLIDVFDPLGNLAGSAITDNNGEYCVDVPAGEYTVEESTINPPEAWTQTSPDIPVITISLPNQWDQSGASFGNAENFCEVGEQAWVQIFGGRDNFTGPNVLPSQSPGMIAFLFDVYGSITQRKFDKTNANDRPFGLTFNLSAIPLTDQITKAQFEMGIKPIGRGSMSDSGNDSITLFYVDNAGVPAVGQHCVRRFGFTNPNPGLMNTVLDPNDIWEYFSFSNRQIQVLDLSALPGGNVSDLMPGLETNRYLDVFIQDDTAIDYLALTVCHKPEIDLDISKTVNNNPWSVGGANQTITLSVTSPGSALSTGNIITVQDALPVGMVAISAGGTDWICNPDTGPIVECTFTVPPGGLPQNATLPDITIDVDVLSFPPEDRVENCAQVYLTGAAQAVQLGEGCDWIIEATGYDLEITKELVNDCVEGEGCFYEITITNNGPGIFTGPLSIVDEWYLSGVPVSGITFLMGEYPWNCTPTSATIEPNGTAVNCDGPSVTLGIDESVTFHIALDVPDELAGEVLINCLRINWPGMDGFDGDTNADNDHACVETIIYDCPPDYDVKIEKTASEGPWTAGDPGDDGYFDFVVTNLGDAINPSVGLVVTDTVMPAGFTITGIDWDPLIWDCENPPFNPGPPGSFTCTYIGGIILNSDELPHIKVYAWGSDDGTFENCAHVELIDETDINPTDNDSCTVVVVDPTYDISIEKGTEGSGDNGQWIAGEAGTFTLNVYNLGGALVSPFAIEVTDNNFPTGFTVTGASGNFWDCTASDYANNDVVCAYTGPDVPAGFAQIGAQITIVAVAGPDDGRFENCAHVGLSGYDETDMDNNDSCVKVIVDPPEGFDLEVLKELIGDCKEGSICSFAITITNNGPATFSGEIAMDDDWGLSDIDFLMGGNPWICSGSASIAECFGPTVTLDPTESISLIIGVTVPDDLDEDTFENCAYINWDNMPDFVDGDLDPTNDKFCIEVDPCDCEDEEHNVTIWKISLGSTGFNGDWVVGESGIFVLNITNIGASIEAPEIVTVSDTMPPGFTLDPPYFVNNWWDCSSSTPTQLSCLYIGPNVVAAPPNTLMNQISFHATPSQPGDFENCAEVMLDGATDVALGNNIKCIKIDVLDPIDDHNVMIEKTSVVSDDFDDLIIGAPSDSPNGTYSGASFVVFGKTDFTPVELSVVEGGTGGFVINGVSNGDQSGYSVSSAGDVNGDGLDDVIVGAHNDSNNFNISGASFVVFGKPGGTTVELSDVENEILISGNDLGFVINGASANNQSGISVSGAGDVNSDGLDDLIVGAAYGSNLGGSAAGTSYVVFGKTDTTPVELSDVENEIGNLGFIIIGVFSGDRAGYSVSGAGDVNGDGFDDLIIGAHGDDPNGNDSGASFVVFGKGSTTPVELSDVENEILVLGAALGFVINGVSTGDQSGISVSGAGDVNGDGLDDLIIGARFDDPNDEASGASFVVFGKKGTTPVALSDVENEIPGSGVALGFVINGVSGYDTSGFPVAAGDRSGNSVSGAGDVNGDGFDDVIVGAYWDDPNGNNSGASFVVFGKGSTTPVELSDVEDEIPGSGIALGFVINGVSGGDNSGYSVSGAGDVNADGLDDLIIGAPNDDPNSNSGSGASFVVFGKNTTTPVELSVVEAGGGGGFVINGVLAVDNSGWSVSGAGNVNGTLSGSWVVGQSGTFVLSITNLGASIEAPEIVTISDLLPPGFTVDSDPSNSNWDCQWQATPMTCTYIGLDVPAGPSSMGSITIHATPGEPGEFENCAEVALVGATDVDLSNNESCIPVVVEEAPKEDDHNVKIEKIAEGSGPNGEWVPGEEGEFILQVTNLGASIDTTGETIIITDDDIPDWFDITLMAGLYWNCTVNAGLQYSISCEYTGPPVASGDPFPPLIIEATPHDYGEFFNCAEVALDGATDVDLSNNESCIPVVVVEPTPPPRHDIMLEKTFVTIQGPAGPITMFVLVVTNLGDPIVAPVTVNVFDNLPPGFTFVPPATGGPVWNCNGLNCVYSGPPIGTGDPFPQIQLIVTTPLMPGVYENCAQAELLNANDIDNSNNTDCIRIEVVDDTPDPRYDIAIDKTSTGGAAGFGGWFPGVPGTFTLNVTNLGAPVNPPGTIIVTDDDFPPWFNIMSAGGNGWNCSWPNNQLTCTYVGGPVGPNQPLPPIVVTAEPGEIGEFVNCVQVALNGVTDFDLSNNESCIPVVSGRPQGSDHNLAIDKSSLGTNWLAASTGTYYLNVTNLGDPVQPPAEVHVTDDLPDGFVINSVNGNNWNCLFGIGASNGLDCEYVGPPIPQGQPYPPIEVVITTPKASGDYRNCATVGIEDVASAGVIDADLSNNESCTVVSVDLGEIPGGGGNVGGVTVVGVFTNLTGTTVVNTRPIGGIDSVTVTGVDDRPIDGVDIREEDGSVTINVNTDRPVGTISVEGPDGTITLNADGARPNGPPGMTWPKDGAVNIQNGNLNETFAVPTSITQGTRPAGDYEVNIGRTPVVVVAVRGGEIAVTGRGIQMQESGETGINIAVKDGPRVSGQIPSWSYQLSAQPVTRLNTWAPIFFQCSGLPNREPITIRFTPEPWQKIEPREISLACGEASSRIQIGQYQTSREGPQNLPAVIDRSPGS